MLSRLIYASKSLVKVDFPLLEDLNDSAVRRNATTGITGLLLYGNSAFLQVLEGGRAAVSATFNRISQDKRHHELVLIGITEIAEREFQDWAMRVVMIDGIQGPRTAALLLKFGVSAQFEPSVLTAGNAHGLLLAHSREFES